MVSAMFADVVGSTAMAERIGDEAMHELLDRFFGLAGEAVGAFGGSINKFLGDGVLAVFGMPVAYEDHAVRAALAALELQRRVGETWDPADPAALRARVGINSGRVVAGRIGSGSESDLSAIGSATNVAARVQERADPGEVLLSAPAAELARGYIVLEPVEEVSLKGLSSPMPLYRATGRGSRRTRTDDPDRRLSPFVGRTRQLGALSDLLDEVRAGRGQIAGIVAEPGMGKSRLVAEFRRRGGPDVAFLEGRCLSYGADTPYVPFADLIRDRAEISQDESGEVAAERLEAMLERLGLDRRRWPYLGGVIGLGASARELADLSPEAVREGVFSTIVDVVLAEAGSNPVVVVLEDLHWMDDVSRDLLERLAEAVHGVPTMLLCTYRPGFQPAWTQRSYATQLSLPRLTDEDAAAIASSLVPGGERDSDLIEEVRAKADGNPFFVEELARALADRGSLDRAPSGIQDVLQARIDLLDNDAKTVLRTAAVLGREAPLAILERLCADGPALASTIDVLTSNEFVFRSETAGQAHLVFTHALTQDVAYGGLLTRARRNLHLRVGEVIEELFADRLEEHYPTLGHHYSEAEEPDRAVRFLGLAADRALASYANRPAAAALERALAMVDRVTLEAAAPLALRLIFRLGFTYYLLGQFGPGRDLLDRNEWRLGDVADRDDLIGAFRFWQSYFETHLGDSEGADRHAHQAIDLSAARGDAVTEGRAHYVLTREDFWLCRFPSGVENGRRACALLETTDEWWWLGHASAWMAINMFSMGDIDGALEAVGRMNAIGAERQDPRLQSYSDWNAGWFEATRGNWELGISHCQRSLNQSPDPLNSAYSTGWLGFAYREKGDHTHASTLLEEAIARLEEFGYSRLVGWFSGWLADAYLWSGRVALAERAADRAHEVSTAVAYPWAVTVAQRARGRIAAANDDRSEARDLLKRAERDFRRMRADFEAAVTTLDLIEVGAREPGDLEVALDAFERARASRYITRASRIDA